MLKSRRRRSGGYGPSHRGGIRSGLGSSTKSNTFTPMIAGFAFGVILDMFYGSLGLPGYDHRASKCEAFSEGDIYQLVGLSVLTFIGFLTRNWIVPAFMFGAMSGALIPKMLSSTGLPRYGIFNMDLSKGAITPIGDGGLRGVYKQLPAIPGITPAAVTPATIAGGALKAGGKPV